MPPGRERNVPKPPPRKKAGRRRRGGGNLRGKAVRDVGLVVRPQLRSLRREGRQARRDYRDYNAQMRNLYGELSREFADIGGDLGSDFAGIQGDYTGGVEDIMGALAQTTAPDQAGFLNTLGTFALAGQNELSSDQSREAAYNASVRRQGGIEGMQVRRNARAELQDQLNDIRFARRGIMADRGPLVMSRLDQLRAQAFDQRMALADLALRRKAAGGLGGESWQSAFIQGFPGPGGPGGPGPGNPRVDPLAAYRRRNRGLGGSGTIFGLGSGTGFDPRQTRRR